MGKVLLYSLLLLLGLIGSQILPADAHGVREAIALCTMAALAFIMIHVGFEFEIDRERPRQYVLDAGVAFSAAAVPWLLCAVYFVFAMKPRELWFYTDAWKSSLLQGLFAAPTSAGVLFSMLAAAGLSATWLFKKARILAIFDDLGTILLMIPMKILLTGMHWQLAVIMVILIALLAAAWFLLRKLPAPHSWPWVLGYAIGITLLCEGIYWASRWFDPSMPVQVEVLLPAFALGCVVHKSGHHDSPADARASTIVSAIFMVLVGLSMPSIVSGGSAGSGHEMLKYAGASAESLAAKNAFPGWGVIGLHVFMITLISNVGKLIPALCYRNEATFKQRLALAVGMFPRGEVGAGVLVIALSYGIAGPALTVAVLSLAVNLMATGVFIMIVKKLLASDAADPAQSSHGVFQPARGETAG